MPNRPDLPEAMRIEMARAAWEADGREIMIENLLITAKVPADIMTGRFDRADLARIRKVATSRALSSWQLHR